MKMMQRQSSLPGSLYFYNDFVKAAPDAPAFLYTDLDGYGFSEFLQTGGVLFTTYDGLTKVSETEIDLP